MPATIKTTDPVSLNISQGTEPHIYRVHIRFAVAAAIAGSTDCVLVTTSLNAATHLPGRATPELIQRAPDSLRAMTLADAADAARLGGPDVQPGRGTVADAVAPPPRHPRFPLIDGMRALAVLAVVGVHTALSGGAVSAGLGGRLLAHLNIGVTIFFLISGFLLYRPMIAHRAGGVPAPALADYARRRFLRIYPAYWAALVILAIVPGVTGVIDGHWWPMAALVHTLPVYHGRGCIDAPSQCGLAQTWSLVVELTFYVALPVYAGAIALATRRLSVRGWVIAELAVLAALSAASVLLQWGVSEPVPLWFGRSACGYVLWFALGMGMAVLSAGLPSRPRCVRVPAGALWLAALAGYVGLSLWLPPSSLLFLRDQQLITHLAFGAIAALLLAPAVFGAGGGGLVRRVLAHRLVAWVGLVSYGIFLWHYAITIKLGNDGAGLGFALLLPVVLALSLACAATSYYLLERPVLRLKNRRISRAPS